MIFEVVSSPVVVTVGGIADEILIFCGVVEQV